MNRMLSSHKLHATWGGVIYDDFKLTIVISLLLHYSTTPPHVLGVYGGGGFFVTSLLDDMSIFHRLGLLPTLSTQIY